MTLEDGTDRLSRNIGTELPFYFAENPKTTQTSRAINVTFQFHLQGSISLTLQEEADMFHESSVTNYRPTSRYFPEERRPQLNPGGSLKSGMTLANSKFGATLDFLNVGNKQIFERHMRFSYNYSPKTRSLFNLYKAHGTCAAWNRRKCKTNTLF